MAQQLSKWSKWSPTYYQSWIISLLPISLLSKMEKRSEVYMRNNNWARTLHCAHTMLTSLRWQPSTRTCCDRFDWNCVNIDNTEPSIATEQCLYINPWCLTISNSGLEINQRDPILLPSLQCTLQCMGHAQKCITGTQTFPISKLYNHWPSGLDNYTTLDKQTLACLQQAGKLPRLTSRRNNTLIRGDNISSSLK